MDTIEAFAPELVQDWEWQLLELIGVPVVVCLIVYIIAFEWYSEQETRRWFKRVHRSPIYGAPNPGRVLGPNSRPNLRRVMP